MIKEKNLEKLIENLKNEMQGKLTPRERDILRLRLGFDDGRIRCFEEIAQLFAMTRTEVEEIIKSVSEKFKEAYQNIMQINCYNLLLSCIFADRYCEIPKNKTEEFINVLDSYLEDLKNESDKSIFQRNIEVLKVRLGIDDGEPKTLEQTGQKFGLSTERIRQIEIQTLRKLRHPRRIIKLRKLREELEKAEEEKMEKAEIERAKFMKEIENIDFFAPLNKSEEN